MLIKSRTIQILLCIFTVLLSTHFCSAGEYNRLQEIRSNINTGIVLYNEGRKKEALPYLEEITDSGIVLPDVYYVLGEIYYEDNELQKAIDSWEISQSQSPKDVIRLKLQRQKKSSKLMKNSVTRSAATLFSNTTRMMRTRPNWSSTHS